MAEYLLPCPHCQHPQAVGTARAGGQVACDDCGEAIVVPKLGELRQQPLAGSGQGPAVVRKSGGGGMFLVAATVAAITILAAAFCTLRWLTIDVPATTASHIAEVTEAYPQASPAELVREYESINRYGIELPRAYGYHAIETRSNQWRTWALVLGGIGLASLAAAVLAARR